MDIEVVNYTENVLDKVRIENSDIGNYIRNHVRKNVGPNIINYNKKFIGTLPDENSKFGNYVRKEVEFDVVN